jgi:hypothetical protein
MPGARMVPCRPNTSRTLSGSELKTKPKTGSCLSIVVLTSSGTLTPSRQQAQSALTVTGIKGNMAVIAVKTGPGVTEYASAELTQLLNTVLENG